MVGAIIGEAATGRDMAGFEATLPELSEGAAQGEIAVIYGELKTFARVPFVALLYRHLATCDEVLPWLWQGLRPSFASGALTDAAERIADVAALPSLVSIRAAEWRLAGLGAEDRVAITAVIEAYNRANPINLACARLVRAVLSGSPSPAVALPLAPERPARPVRPALPPLPPILPASAIPAETSGALAALSRYGRPASGALTPSLYRHLAHWPGYLGLLPARLAPAYKLGAIDAAVAHYRGAAESELPALLAPLVPLLDPARRPSEALSRSLVETLDAFAGLIPEMIAVGRLLRLGLPAETI